MALVTIRILDGPERGKSYRQIATPVTIGREEGNYIQLNDERVSRYHLKIHENGGAILLTDLQSTNGTRVNGEVVQVWHLRPGDVISAGRTVLVFGSSEEIASRLSNLKKKDCSASIPMGIDGEDFSYAGKQFEKAIGSEASSALFELEIFSGMTPEELAPLHLLAPPEPPRGLAPRDAAQLTEYLQYIHLRLRYLISTVRSAPSEALGGGEGTEAARVTLDGSQWQNLIDLHDRISRQLNSVTEP